MYSKTLEKYILGEGNIKFFAIPAVILITWYFFTVDLRNSTIYVWGIIILGIIALFLEKKTPIYLQVPLSFKLLTFNVTGVTLIIFGLDRFMTPINYILMLSAIVYAIELLGLSTLINDHVIIK